MQTSFHRYLEVSKTRSQGNQVHARFERTWKSSSKAPEKRPRRRRIQQGKIQRDLRGANRFRGDFWAAIGITAVGDRFKAGMFFGKWNDMKWDVIPWYWCNDKTWKSWLIQYSSSNLSGWKWTGKRLQEKKQRLLALAKQKREEVAATAKSRLRIWVCFWNPLFFVTLDRKDIIFSGSASRAFLFNLRRLIQWPLVPRKISGFRKSSSKVKATRPFWHFFLPSYGPVRLSWCRGSDFQDSDQLEDYMVSTRKQKALWIGTWAFYFVQVDAVVMSWKLLGHCWLGTSSQSGCQREGAPRVNSLWNHKVSSLSLFSSPFLAVRKAKRRFFKVDPNVCGFEFKCPISL